MKRTRQIGFGLGSMVFVSMMFALAPSEAKAIEVQCSNDNGTCTVQNTPWDFTSCNCGEWGGDVGEGGDMLGGMSEAELLEYCNDMLSLCEPPPEEDSGEGTSTTGWEPETGTDDEGFEDTGFGDSDSTTFGGTTVGGTTYGSDDGTDSFSDTLGDDTDSLSSTDSGDPTDTFSSSSTTAEDTGDTVADTADSGGEEAADDGDGGGSGHGHGHGHGHGNGPWDDVIGCSVTNNTGFGLMALFGVFGLLGLRSRRRS